MWLVMVAVDEGYIGNLTSVIYTSSLTSRGTKAQRDREHGADVKIDLEKVHLVLSPSQHGLNPLECH